MRETEERFRRMGVDASEKGDKTGDDRLGVVKELNGAAEIRPLSDGDAGFKMHEI